MDFTIRGSPKEIAALVLALQGRQQEAGIPNPLGTITESFQKAIDDTEREEQAAL